MTTATEKPRQKLFDIGKDLLELNALIDERGGDLSDPEVEAAIVQWFNEIEGDQAAKLEGYYWLIKQREMRAALAKAEADLWAAGLADRQAKARTEENAAKGLKERVKAYLELTGQQKAETTTGHEFRIQKNGGAVPLVVADPLDPVKVPDDYVRWRWELDREKVREALERGEKLPFAFLGERGTQIRVR